MCVTKTQSPSNVDLRVATLSYVHICFTFYSVLQFNPSFSYTILELLSYYV